MTIPVYQDVMFLFRFISYSGASTFVQYGEGISNPSKMIRAIRIFQKVACCIAFLLLLSMSVFELVQFGLLIWTMDSVGEIIPNIVWMTSFPLAIMAQIFYALKRSVLVKFFQRWGNIHVSYPLSNETKSFEVRSRPRMYYVYLLTVCVSVTMIIVLILDFPILTFLPSTYLAEKDRLDQHIASSSTLTFTNNIFITCVLFSVTLFYSWNLSAASDLVPSMIYYHLARDIEKTGNYFENDISETPTHSVKQIEHNKLVIAVEENMNDESERTETACLPKVPNSGKGLSEPVHNVQQDWQKGWLYYEAIRELVNESNTRFGPMMLLNHGAMFFVASSNIFSILRWYRGMSWVLLLVNGINAAATLLRLISTILMCSKVSRAAERLQSKVSTHLAANWFRFGVSERQFFTALLVRVHDKGAIVSPLGLYLVRPSMFLALLSLLITYMVVMLQTSDTGIFASYGNYTGLITGTKFYTHHQ